MIVGLLLDLQGTRDMHQKANMTAIVDNTIPAHTFV